MLESFQLQKLLGKYIYMYPCKHSCLNVCDLPRVIIIGLFHLLDENVKAENEVNSKQDSVSASNKVTLT